MLLADVVAAWRAVAATSARTRKVAVLADTLRTATADEAAVVVPWLSGELRQRRTGIGWAVLRDAPAPAGTPSLRVAEVDATFERVAGLSGAGSSGERRRVVHDLFARATEHFGRGGSISDNGSHRRIRRELRLLGDIG